MFGVNAPSSKVVFQDGKPVKQIVGARPKAALLSDLAAYLVELDDFIEREIKPLEQANDTIRVGQRIF